MKTFSGKFLGRNFVYSSDNEAIRMQLISILNTPLGSRFYYPSYGSTLNNFRFSVLNYFTINMIGQEIKRAVSLIDGVSLASIGYSVKENTIYFDIALNRMSEIVKLKLSVTDGVAS